MRGYLRKNPHQKSERNPDYWGQMDFAGEKLSITCISNKPYYNMTFLGEDHREVGIGEIEFYQGDWFGDAVLDGHEVIFTVRLNTTDQPYLEFTGRYKDESLH